MSDIKYPIYRKFKNGKEFMKLNSTGKMIKVLFVRENSFNIMHSDSNQFMKEDFNNPDLSVESTRDEWEKAYGQAQYQLCKSNCEQ